MKVLAPLLLVLVASCGTQGVGERCDKLNGNLDCDDGLTCSPVTQTYSLCCPLTGQLPSVCNVSTNQQGPGIIPVGDGGREAAAETGTSSDASSAAETGAGD